MKLRWANQVTGEPEKYATSGDFCALFTQEMNSLYLCSFLLTGDHEKAEQCFVAGLEDCVNGNPVFKQWARSWARRMIVENAIRMIAPRPNRTPGSALALHLEFNSEVQTLCNKAAVIASVFELEDFERFVFMLSVLERYPDQDCSILLGCSLEEISEARTRALQQIAQSYATHGVALIHSANRSAETLAH